MSEPRPTEAIRADLANIYARRHAPGSSWETIEDVEPRELVEIIWDDADAIMDGVVGPLLARVAELEQENERLHEIAAKLSRTGQCGHKWAGDQDHNPHECRLWSQHLSQHLCGCGVKG